MADAALMDPAPMEGLPMSAGTYLRKRREAEGLSIAEVAAGAMPPANREAFAARLVDVEADRDKFARPTLALMRGVFHFVPDIYLGLASGVPSFQLCRNCACSWLDACTGSTGPCSWVEPDLCSACKDAPALPEPRLMIPASDPFAVPLAAILADLRMARWDRAIATLDGLVTDHRAHTPHPASIDAPGAATAIAVHAELQGWRVRNLDHLPKGETVHV